MAILDALQTLNAPNQAPTWAVLGIIPLFLLLGMVLGTAYSEWHDERFERRARRRGWRPPGGDP